jgi:hypothetical protein
LSIDRLINVLVTVTLFEMMVAIGLGVTFADLVDVAKSGASQHGQTGKTWNG